MRADVTRAGEAGEHHPHRDLVQELVSGRHPLQDGGQLHVLDQVAAVSRQVRSDIEVGVAVQQVRLHGRSLSRSWS